VIEELAEQYEEAVRRRNARVEGADEVIVLASRIVQTRLRIDLPRPPLATVSRAPQLVTVATPWES